MTAEELVRKMEQDLSESGGHCGESTSEIIMRQRWEERLAVAIKIIHQYLKK